VVIAVTAMAAAVATAIVAAPRRTPGQRLSDLQPTVGPRGNAGRARGQPGPSGGDGRLRSPPARRVAAAAAVVAGIVVLGPLLGLLAGGGLATVALCCTVGPPQPAIDGAAVALVADLVAGCLTAGTLLDDAIDAAGEATEGALGERCRAVATALRAGASPERAWAGWLADPRLAAIARTAVRTAHSGAATAEELRRTAARLRVQRKAALQQRVRQASVWVVVPLGLCFLPAFVLVAVVPLVVGLLPSLS
jgi:Flp pilus assembly protein TadB